MGEEGVARSGHGVSHSGSFPVTRAPSVSRLPRQPGVKRTGRGVGEGRDLVDDHPLARAVVTGLFEQGAELGVEAVRGALTSTFVTVVALVGVHALAQSPLAGAPLVVAMGLLLLGYRAYSGLSERHLSLERLYRFSHAVRGS